MKLKLTLHRPKGPQSDIVVTADASATVASLAQTISDVDPLRKVAHDGGTVRTLTLLSSQGGGTRHLDPELTLGDSPLASGADVGLALGSDALPPPTSAAVVATITVTQGPDAGASFPLAVGTRYLGRERGLDITLTDPLVSKRHARIDVSPGVVRLVDLNSANGIEVDGAPVTRVELAHGATAVVGDTTLSVSIAPVQDDHDFFAEGPIPFTRSPRVERRYPGKEYPGPRLPGPLEASPFPWLAMAAPLLLGPILFLVTERWVTLIFMAMAPLIMVGTWLTNRSQRKAKHKAAVEQFDEQLELLERDLAEQVPIERTVRLAEVPSTAEVYDEAMKLGPVLWTRRPEHWSFLSLRLGLGTLPSRNTVDVSGEESGLPEYRLRLREMMERYENAHGVPLSESLYDSGALGVVGDGPVAADVARGILTQLVGLHSPAEVVVTSMVGPKWTPELEWLKWLPHTASPSSPIETAHLTNSQASAGQLLAALEEIALQRGKKQQQRGAEAFDKSAIVTGAKVGEDGSISAPPVPVPAIIVVISEDAPVDRARIIQLAEAAADAGIFPIWLSPDVASLPAVSRTYIEAGDDENNSAVGYVRLGERIAPVATERVSRQQALALAKRLAPVFDAGYAVADASDLPQSISILTLLGHDLADSHEAQLERWKQNDSVHDRSGAPPKRSKRSGRLRAIVGQSAVDAMHLDLRTQGPHALVGGTTGSGKSEFLQAWVLGMAAEYSPDRVTFLFVDYKGGSAFADCVNLPHCVGLVTDLSPHLVRRALTSLRAELHYREHLFNRKKAKDLLELEKRGDPESPPALVLVIDEFAALVGEVPEFVDGVVDIAQRGRSLGIHLIMATQRPAGVIKDNLRANTNLRIALRMADESDSQDVVGDPIAGTFDPSLPGRGIAKTGPGRLTPFQSAYAGGYTSLEPDIPSITVGELRFGAEQLWDRPSTAEAAPAVEEAEQGPTDQARLVRTMIEAATRAAIPAPRRPWLDELANVYDLTKLRQRTDTELVLGVADLPELQEQRELYFRPDVDGNIAVYGSSGTGKSTTLRSLAVAAGITPRGGPVDVYGMDFGSGALTMLEQLPHVGSIVGGDDAERVIRLLRTLRAELEDRSARYTAVNAATITEYRRLANAPDERRILLLVDNFPAFRAEFEVGASRQQWYGVFQQLLQEGRALGIHVAFSADRPGSVPSAISSTVPRKIVLRMAEEGAYFLLDAPADVLSAASPPGRAIVDGMETQLAVVGGAANVAEQSRVIRELADAIARTGRTPAEPVGTLPTEYPTTDLPDSLGDLAVLGISELDLEPIGFDPTGVFLLAGPPASGRTNALRVLVESLDRAVTPTRYYIGNPRSELGRLPGWEATATVMDDVIDLAKELTASITEGPAGKVVVVIEQLADFLSSSADAPLVELIKTIKRSDHFLLADSETGQWGSSWPLLGEIKAARTGFLLQPETMEGDTILKTSLPRVSRGEFPPGRGYYIARGKATRVQLPIARQ